MEHGHGAYVCNVHVYCSTLMYVCMCVCACVYTHTFSTEKTSVTSSTAGNQCCGVVGVCGQICELASTLGCEIRGQDGVCSTAFSSGRDFANCRSSVSVR